MTARAVVAFPFAWGSFSKSCQQRASAILDPMKPPLSYRLQEWAADHFTGVQYPQLGPVTPPRRLFFKYQMPWYQRLFVAAVSLVMIGASLVLLAGLLFLAYFLFLK